MADNNGQRFAGNWYMIISRELNDQFNGVTIYQQAPVTGLWKEEEQKTVKDELIIYEVMADQMDLVYWEIMDKSNL